jgi:hypothetical protein
MLPRKIHRLRQGNINRQTGKYVGSPANQTSLFLTSHPLQETLVQRLNSTMKIPEIYGRAPPMLSPKPEDEPRLAI